jgi:hypothetical protein
MISANDRMRELVLAIGADMSDASNATRAQWNELVELLALDPAPVRYGCPFCGKLIMLAATRCGYCWKSVAPASTQSITSS